MLSIPVWVDGRLRASVNFFSRTAGHFTQEDVLVGRRIADHISLVLSHQRLVEEKRRRRVARARGELELLDDLLARLSHIRELDEVVDRVSVIASRVLPHDVMVLRCSADGRHARVYARGGVDAAACPTSSPVRPAFREPRLGIRHRRRSASHPVQRNRTRRAAIARCCACRSASTAAWRRRCRFCLAAPRPTETADVPVARRIADRLALSLSRERGIEASAARRRSHRARAAQLEARVRALTEELDARTGYRRVVGESAPWRQVLTQATQVAATDTTVLLLGESGTGKEVVARFLHRASPRRDGPFIALNCAALPEQLLEAELFGYERGAFTGATQSKPGQLEQAAGGTLFLDEVGEMSPPAQAKFLRVLQEREFQRLGGTRVAAHRRAHRRRDQPRSAARDGAGHVPRGSVLPAQRVRASGCRRCASGATTCCR